jgi:hypothetical protein
MADEDEKDDSPDPMEEIADLGEGEDGEHRDDGEDGEEEIDEGPLTSADFHNIAQKQILNAVFAVLADTKMEWSLVSPFLEAARDLCLGDFEETGRVRLHTLRAEAGEWVEAEEAFLGISVSDRDDGVEWLSETYWLSEIATADGDVEQVRAILRALERSIARINLWLAGQPGGAAGAAAPPAEPQ